MQEKARLKVEIHPKCFQSSQDEHQEIKSCSGRKTFQQLGRHGLKHREKIHG